VRVLGKAGAAAFALGLIGLGVFATTRLEVSTKITHFLPGGEESELTRLSQSLAESELVRTIIVTVETERREDSAKAIGALGDRLAKIEGVAWVRSGVDPELEQAVRSLYFDRRWYFVSDRPESIDLSDDGLVNAAREVKRQLAMPMSALVRPMVTQDPLLSFLGQLLRMQAARVGELDLTDGRFVTKDGKHGVLFMASKESPFKGQAPLVEAIEAAFAEIRTSHPAVKSIEQSSVHRFAVRSERSITADVSRISTLSTIGVLLLFLLLFRSLRYVILTLVPMATGIFASIIACWIGFPAIHGITLAFGSSMIGVCVDYGVHLLNHHALSEKGTSPVDSLRRVWPGMLLGAATTAAGLAAMLWTTFPGIREIAVFGVVGVIASLITTRLVLPAFMPIDREPVLLHKRMAEALGRALDAVLARKRWILLGWVPVLAIAAFGYPRLRWNDQLSALNHLDPELLAEDVRVRARVSRMEAGQIVAVIGADEQEALEKNDRVHRVLEDGKKVAQFRSIHSFLWSEKLQRENWEQLRSAKLETRLPQAFASEGFAADAFAPFAQSLSSTITPLTFADLEATPIGPLIEPFRGSIGDRVVLFTFVRGVQDPEALEKDLAAIDGAFFFDQHRFLAGAYGQYRQRTLELMGLGLVIVFLIVLVRYRRLRLTFAAFFPALLAAASTLGVLGLAGLEANLMHLVALLLVLSMGVDYGIFMVEHRSDPESRSATLLSIVIACLTTVLSFGALALSINPALRALGVSVFVGDVLSLLLAPTALGLLPERDRSLDPASIAP
jgi:predicted exporter